MLTPAGGERDFQHLCNSHWLKKMMFSSVLREALLVEVKVNSQSTGTTSVEVHQVAFTPMYTLPFYFLRNDLYDWYTIAIPFWVNFPLKMSHTGSVVWWQNSIYTTILRNWTKKLLAIYTTGSMLNSMQVPISVLTNQVKLYYMEIYRVASISHCHQ